jgi:hypothetical protein
MSLREPPILIPVHEPEVRLANMIACERAGTGPYARTSLTQVEYPRGGVTLLSPYKQDVELRTMYAVVDRIFTTRSSLAMLVESITAEKAEATYTVKVWDDCWSAREAEMLGNLIASALVRERGGHNGIVILGDSPREEYRVGSLWVDAPF